MRIGVMYPTNRVPSDPGVVRAFAAAVSELGFDHVTTFDHVLGINRASRPEFNHFYDHTAHFDEPLTMLAYLAALLPDVELATSVLVLPQRQTAVVAKQAAQLDLLSSAGLRLGVGIGWNEVEFVALGQDFRTRASRMEEQIEVMRRLWSEELLTFEGRWDRVLDAGMNPLPSRRIPIWIGASSDQAIRRAARIGDGFLPRFPPGDEGLKALDALRQHLGAADRSHEDFGIDGMVGADDMMKHAITGAEEWARDTQWWREQGATHVTLWMHYGERWDVDALIDAMRQFRALVPSATQN